MMQDGGRMENRQRGFPFDVVDPHENRAPPGVLEKEFFPEILP